MFAILLNYEEFISSEARDSGLFILVTPIYLGPAVLPRPFHFLSACRANPRTVS